MCSSTIVLILFRGLGQQYNAFTTSIQTRADDLTFENVLALLHSNEATNQFSQGHSDSLLEPAANAAYTNGVATIITI